jgi:citrate lyase subunit beta/citryl-CoA lyase
MIGKAAGLSCDEVILDLEDAVAPAAKADARATVAECLGTEAFAAATVAVRINPVGSGYAYGDIIAVVEGGQSALAALVVPTVEEAADVHFVDRLLDEVESALSLECPVGIEVQIESSRALVNLAEIGRASRRLVAFVFGEGDYAADIGTGDLVIGSPGGAHADRFLWAQSMVASHARAVRCDAIDGAYARFRDADGFLSAARRARSLGYDGKWCIHPDQIDLAVRAFTPSDEEIERARAIVRAYEAAERRGDGVATLDGEMIDEASRKLAARVLADA